MKRVILTSLRPFILGTALVIFLLNSVTIAQETGVKFYKLNLPEAIVKAKGENKIVMIEFWAPSCLPCINLSKYVFQNAEYGEYLNKYLISIKLSPTDKKYNDLWKKYNLVVQSTVVFLNGDGEEIERRCDYDGNSEKYFNFIKDVIAGKNLYSDMLKELKKDSLNVELNYRMGVKCIDRYEYTKANKYLNNVIQSDAEDKSGYLDDSKFRLAYYDFMYKNNITKTLDFLHTGKSKSLLSKGFISIINHYISKKEKEKCLALCEDAVVKLNDDPDIFNRYAWAIYSFNIKNRFKEGVEYTQKAISLNPNKANYYDTQAWLYYKDGNTDKAIESMNKAIEINPHPEYKKNLETMKSAK